MDVPIFTQSACESTTIRLAGGLDFTAKGGKRQGKCPHRCGRNRVRSTAMAGFGKPNQEQANFRFRTDGLFHISHSFGRWLLMDSRFHRRLIDAQDFRNIGDYGVEAHVLKDDANSVCEWASEFIDQAEAFLLEDGD